MSVRATDPAVDGHGVRTDRQAMITVRDLTKTYPSGVRAVDGLDLSVPAGQVFGFLGPNGAGKTTALKMMLGLITPTTGHIALNGCDIHAQRAAAVSQVGAVLEGARNVYRQFSAWQNLMYFGRLKGLAARDVEPRARWLLERLELWGRHDEPVGGYSRGMQQKVAVAAALVADPAVLLLDEPTVGLDVASARTTKGWIRNLAEAHAKTIVLTSHRLETVEELADRVAVMREGRVVADLPTGQLLDRFRRRSHYEIVVDGHLPPQAVPGRFTAETTDGITRLTGTVDDAGSLYPLLGRLRDSGVTLRSVSQHQPDLEEVFLQLVNDAPPAADGAGR